MTYNFSNVSVLVVEDSQPMTQITCALLKGFGIQKVHVAATSDQAFEKFREEKYDLILIDWLIKPDNGIDLTHKIRTDSLSPNPFVPIIIMTGFSEKKRVVLARDKGVTEFLVKPFTANDLYRRIDHIIMKPREFVDAPGFFGPDRRRKFLDEELTPQRRTDDKNND